MRRSLFAVPPTEGCAQNYRNLWEPPNARSALARQQCEDLWRDFADLADNDFIDRFPFELHQRWFEMYLGASLRRTGLNPSAPKPGPDFQVIVEHAPILGLIQDLQVAYIRFIVANAHPDSGVAAGIFTAAYGLRGSDNVSGADRESLQEQLQWFLKHLPIPKRFNRSRSKGYYRRNTKGIAWLRDTALEHISRMHELKRILDANGVPVHIVREDRVGYVVYKDHVQVIAEPFSDTETGP